MPPTGNHHRAPTARRQLPRSTSRSSSNPLWPGRPTIRSSESPSTGLPLTVRPDFDESPLPSALRLRVEEFSLFLHRAVLGLAGEQVDGLVAGAQVRLLLGLLLLGAVALEDHLGGDGVGKVDHSAPVAEPHADREQKDNVDPPVRDEVADQFERLSFEIEDVEVEVGSS